MKDIIYDNLPSLNIKLAKNKFLQSCYPMPAYMPEACTSFIKMIQQCLDNVISFASKALYDNVKKDIVWTCFLQSSQAPLCKRQADDSACKRTPVLIGFDHSFCLQTCLQEKDMDKDYMQKKPIHC